MAASQEVLKSWGMSAASLRGDGYKPPMKCGSRVVFWSWVGQMCPSSVRAAHPNPSPLVVGCQAKSLVGAATHSSCHCLLWGQFVPRSCRVLGDSSREKGGQVTGHKHSILAQCSMSDRALPRLEGLGDSPAG